MIWILRYKPGIDRVFEAMIEAGDEQKALEVGTVYCLKNKTFTFVGIKPFIVADESILEDEDYSEEPPKRGPGRPPKER